MQMSIQELQRRMASLRPRGDSEERVAPLADQVAWLEEQCALLVRSRDARTSFTSTLDGEVEGVVSAPVHTILDAWNDAVDRAQVQADDRSKQIREVADDEVRRLCTRKAVLLARLIRNAAAQNSHGQHAFFSLVPAALSVLWRTTSFALEQDKDMQLLSRTVVQMLANLVTDNDQLQARLWEDHLDIRGRTAISHNGRPVSDVICRLLASPDLGTQTATQVLLVNLSFSSSARTADVAETVAGADIMGSLLHTIHTHLEEDEEDEEADETSASKGGEDGIAVQPSINLEQERRRRYEGLGILYGFFANLFARGFFDEAFDNLRSITPEDSHIDASLISSAQVTLLKLLDSHVHFDRQADGAPDADDDAVEANDKDMSSLTSIFVNLASWADATMLAVLNQPNSASAPVDSRLVEVHVGLILVLQCLATLAIATEKDSAEPAHARLAITGERLLAEMRTDAFLTTLIALMRSTHAFSPAVSPFVAAANAEQGKRARQVPTTAPLPDGHVLSSTGQAALAAESGANAAPRPRLDKLKRDQVGLLGVLAYRRGAHDTEVVQRVQDTVRERGGLLDVLNLTQLDDRNPYIRERAIFALRNLLQGNAVSQELIAQLKPVDPEAQATVRANGGA